MTERQSSFLDMIPKRGDTEFTGVIPPTKTVPKDRVQSNSQTDSEQDINKILTTPEQRARAAEIKQNLPDGTVVTTQLILSIMQEEDAKSNKIHYDKD